MCLKLWQHENANNAKALETERNRGRSTVGRQGRVKKIRNSFGGSACLRKLRSIFELKLNNYSTKTLNPAKMHRAKAKMLIKRPSWVYADLWNTRKRDIPVCKYANTHNKGLYMEKTHLPTHNHRPPVLFFQRACFHQSITRELSLVVSLASASFFLLAGWWSDGWCLYFFHRINWTLSSWLMCSGSLLDLDQLDSSRVKTTGT